MDVAPDLDPAELQRLLPGRAVRSYPALLSTEADALAWARGGAPPGAVVVADYQASPRGRGGLPWRVEQGVGLGFSVVLRPALPAAREGWLYSVATVGIADVLATAADDVSIEWPDQVMVGGRRGAALGVAAEVGPTGVGWAVVNVLVDDVAAPRGPTLARLVTAVETRLVEDVDVVLVEHRRRCATLGRTVRAHVVPMGPTGVKVEGAAVDVLPDGALLVETDRGSRIAVLPHHLGALDDLDADGPSGAGPGGVR